MTTRADVGSWITAPVTQVAGSTPESIRRFAQYRYRQLRTVIDQADEIIDGLTSDDDAVRAEAAEWAVKWLRRWRGCPVCGESPDEGRDLCAPCYREEVNL